VPVVAEAILKWGTRLRPKAKSGGEVLGEGAASPLPSTPAREYGGAL